VIRLACERPADNLVPLARWSSSELAREAVARGICEQISGVTVWRWLAADAIKPWQYRSWIFPRDPEFTAKAGRILDLYSGRWEGELLHPGDYVVCCDEKPSIQARARKHTALPAIGAVKRGQRVEHEGRAARRAVLFRGVGRPPREAVRPLRRQGRDRPVRQARRAVYERRALQQGPARVRDRRQRLSAPRQEINQAPPRPLQEPDPRPHPCPRQLAQPSRDLLLDRPTQGLTPNDFADLDTLEQQLLAFGRRYEQIAQPFEWKFTRADLDRVAERLDRPAAQAA
jgi:hypothetical protein